MSWYLPLGQPLDLTSMIVAIQKIEARKALWELITLYTAHIQEWRQLLFSEVINTGNLANNKENMFVRFMLTDFTVEICIYIFQFVLSHAQEKVDVWQQQAVSLTKTISTQDAVLQETMQTLEHFNLQLQVMAKLSSPTLKHKHWRNIFKG